MTNPIAEQLKLTIVEALHQVLDDGDSEFRPILIKRIPFICNDIRQIKTDMVWIKWFMMGIMGGLGAIIIGTVIQRLT